MKIYSIGDIRHLESISTVILFKFRPDDFSNVSNLFYFFSHASPNYIEGKTSNITLHHRLKHFDEVPKRFDVKISPADGLTLKEPWK